MLNKWCDDEDKAGEFGWSSRWLREWDRERERETWLQFAVDIFSRHNKVWKVIFFQFPIASFYICHVWRRRTSFSFCYEKSLRQLPSFFQTPSRLLARGAGRTCYYFFVTICPPPPSPIHRLSPSHFCVINDAFTDLPLLVARNYSYFTDMFAIIIPEYT